MRSRRFPRAWWLGTLAAVAAVALVFGLRLHDALLFKLALKSDSPDTDVLTRVVERSAEPGLLTRELWQTGRIPHRGLALNLARERKPMSALDAALFEEACFDPDLAVREIALSHLSSQPGVNLVELLKPHLRDADPDVRLLALGHLGRLDASNVIRVVAPLLDDPEPSVSKTAAVMLQRASGRDFGIRFQPARNASNANLHANAAPSTNLNPLREWVRSRDDGGAPMAPGDPPRLVRLAADDFALPDLNGKLVRLSDFRGRVVFLNFWATWCAVCTAEIPALNDLQQHFEGQLVILGIALDGAPEDHDHDHESGSGNGAKARAPVAPAEHVRQFAKRRGIRYTVLLDPAMQVGRRFNAGELPTQVFLDREGRVARRFVGPRSPAAFRAIVEGLLEPPQPASSGRNP